MSRSEKSELTEEAHRIIKTIKQMEASLEDSKPSNTYPLDHHDLKVTIPLTRCLQNLKAKHNTIAKIHQERFEQVKSNIYQSHDRRRLNSSRTSTSSRVILVSSGAFVRPYFSTTYFKRSVGSTNLRPFSVIRDKAR